MKKTVMILVIATMVAWGLRSIVHARGKPSCCVILAERESGWKPTLVPISQGDWTSPQMPKAPRAPTLPKPPANPGRNGHGKSALTWEALSSQYHAKEHDAYLDALVMARAELVKRLSELKPGTDFEPDLEVMERFVKSKEVLPETLEDTTDKITVVKVKLKLEMNQGQRDEMLRKVRLGEAWSRQLGLGKIMIGVLAILATAAGYFRLEDRTKGYYTGWLKFGVLAALALLGLAYFALA